MYYPVKKRGLHDDNITQKEFSQYRTPHGPQSSSQFNCNIAKAYLPTEQPLPISLTGMFNFMELDAS